MDSELGLFSIEVLGDNQNSQLVNRCRTMMNDLYGETKNIVTLNLDQLKKITDELLIKESLNDDDIKQCLSRCA